MALMVVQDCELLDQFRNLVLSRVLLLLSAQSKLLTPSGSGAAAAGGSRPFSHDAPPLDVRQGHKACLMEGVSYRTGRSFPWGIAKPPPK